MTAAPLPAPLPCPFCGTEPTISALVHGGTVWMHPRTDNQCPANEWQAYAPGTQAAWNRRAPEAQAWRAGEGPKDGTVVWLAGHHWGDPRLKHWVTRGSWREVDGTTGWHDLDHAPTNLYPPTHWMPDDPPAPPGATPAAPPAREAELVEAIRYFLDYEDDRDPFRTREQAVARLRAALAEAEGRALP